jgi:hypothetical protein
LTVLHNPQSDFVESRKFIHASHNISAVPCEAPSRRHFSDADLDLRARAPSLRRAGGPPSPPRGKVARGFPDFGAEALRRSLSCRSRKRRVTTHLGAEPPPRGRRRAGIPRAIGIREA